MHSMPKEYNVVQYLKREILDTAYSLLLRFFRPNAAIHHDKQKLKLLVLKYIASPAEVKT